MRILIFLSVLTLIACSKEPKGPDLSNVEFTETYHYNGQLKSIGKYVNDKLEGEFKRYYESGQLRQIVNFVNGKEEGEWKSYHKN